MTPETYLAALRRERQAFPDRAEEIDAEIVGAEADLAAAESVALVTVTDVENEIAQLLGDDESKKVRR